MFEKESQDYAMREVAPRQELYIKGRADIDADYEKVKKIWQDGAKYGYSKANEWHFVKDGDLPKEEKEYLVIYESDHTKYIGLENYYIDTKEWSTICNIIAWKEIVLSELPEEDRK